MPYVTYKWGWLQTRGRSGGRSSAKLGGRSRGECVGGARCDLLQMDWSISHCVIDFLQWNSIPPQLVFVVCWSTHWCGVQNKPLCRYPLCSMYPTHQVPPPPLPHTFPNTWSHTCRIFSNSSTSSGMVLTMSLTSTAFLSCDCSTLSKPAQECTARPCSMVTTR